MSRERGEAFPGVHGPQFDLPVVRAGNDVFVLLCQEDAQIERKMLSTKRPNLEDDWIATQQI